MEAPHIEELIVVEAPRGAGISDADPRRTVTRIFSKDGKLVGELDPCAPEYLHAHETDCIHGTWKLDGQIIFGHHVLPITGEYGRFETPPVPYRQAMKETVEFMVEYGIGHGLIPKGMDLKEFIPFMQSLCPQIDWPSPRRSGAKEPPAPPTPPTSEVIAENQDEEK